MSYLNGLNDWGDDTEESLGDLAEEKLEDKVKDKAEDGAKKTGKAGIDALDRMTDKISPVKKAKDAVKNKVGAVRNFKKKAKAKAGELMKGGVKAVGKAAFNAMKGILSWAVANPIPALIILIIIILIFVLCDISVDDVDIDGGNVETGLQDESVYNEFDGLTDDDIVVILMEDCMEQEYATMGEMDTDKEASAKYIYSVFRSFGFTNASIAGMLGNIDIESGLDPSAIEGIYNEYGYLGTAKANALLSMSGYTVNTLWPKYEAAGKTIRKDGYKAVSPSGTVNYYCGMGLVQWTGSNALSLLSAAETVGMDWYTMDFQMAYLLCDSLYRPGFFTEWVANQEATDDVEAAKSAAVYFAHGFEGNSSNDEERSTNAATWYGIIGSWGDENVDEEFVDSITELATQLGGVIEFTDIANASYRCKNNNIFDNSSLASAAISYAWPKKEQSYNNGTNLYQAVINGIWPGDQHFKACDRAVAGAVRWSGTDDEYPLVTSTQLSYLASSPKWELVGEATDLTMDDLQPGDVFILDGHTLMFVGESAVTTAYAEEADPGSNSVSASLNERSASCNADVTGYMERGDSRGTYQVYRCTAPDNSTTYKNIGSGISN